MMGQVFRSLLALVLAVLCGLPGYSASSASTKGKGYYPNKAAAYADSKWAADGDDYATKRRDVTFVRKCMEAGGVVFTKYISTPGALLAYLADNGYATCYEGDDVVVENIKKGDVVAVACSNHSHMFGVQVMLVSQGYDSASDSICVDSMSLSYHNKSFTSSQLENLPSTVECSSCFGMSYNYLLHLSMNNSFEQEFTIPPESVAESPAVTPPTYAEDGGDGSSMPDAYALFQDYLYTNFNGKDRENICGTFADLSGDGVAELVLVEAINGQMSSNSAIPMTVTVYMLVNSAVKPIYSENIYISHAEMNDIYLAIYNNACYLLRRSLGAGTGLWWDNFKAFCFDNKGKIVTFEENMGLQGSIDNPNSDPGKQEKKAYYTALNKYMANCLSVACCVEDIGCELPTLTELLDGTGGSRPNSKLKGGYELPATNTEENTQDAVEVRSAEGYTAFTYDMPNSTYASSELTAEGTYFCVERAFDNNKNTSWQEDAAGLGVGEYVGQAFGAPTQIDMIRVRPGYAKDVNTYQANGRPKTMLVSMLGENETRTYRLHFSDENRDFYFQLPNMDGWMCFDIKLIVEDAYEGLYYEDLAISDVCFYHKDW